MADQLAVKDFAAKIRERRPDLSSISDTDLVLRTVANAPSLRKFVNMRELLSQSKEQMGQADVKAKHPVLSQLREQAQPLRLLGEAAKGFGSMIAAVPAMAYGLVGPSQEGSQAEKGFGPGVIAPRIIGGVARTVGEAIWPTGPQGQETPAAERLGGAILGPQIVEQLKTDPLGAMTRLGGMGGAGELMMGALGITRGISKMGVVKPQAGYKILGSLLSDSPEAMHAKVSVPSAEQLATGARPSEAMAVSYPWLEKALHEMAPVARRFGFKLSDEGVAGVIATGRVAMDEMWQKWVAATGAFKNFPAIRVTNEYVASAVEHLRGVVPSEEAALVGLSKKISLKQPLTLDEAHYLTTLMRKRLKSTYERGSEAIKSETLASDRERLLVGRKALRQQMYDFADKLTATPVAQQALRTWGALDDVVTRSEDFVRKLAYKEGAPDPISWSELYHGARAAGATNVATAGVHATIAAGRRLLGSGWKSAAKRFNKGLRAFDDLSSKFGPMPALGAGPGLPPAGPHPGQPQLPGVPPQLSAPPQPPQSSGPIPGGGTPPTTPQPQPVAALSQAQAPPPQATVPKPQVVPPQAPAQSGTVGTLAQKPRDFPLLRQELLDPAIRAKWLDKVRGASRETLAKAEEQIRKAKGLSPSVSPGPPPGAIDAELDNQAARMYGTEERPKLFNDLTSQQKKLAIKASEAVKDWRKEGLSQDEISKRLAKSEAFKPRTTEAAIRRKLHDQERKAGVSREGQPSQTVGLEAVKGKAAPGANPEEAIIQEETDRRASEMLSRLEARLKGASEKDAEAIRKEFAREWLKYGRSVRGSSPGFAEDKIFEFEGLSDTDLVRRGAELNDKKLLLAINKEGFSNRSLVPKFQKLLERHSNLIQSEGEKMVRSMAKKRTDSELQSWLSSTTNEPERKILSEELQSRRGGKLPFFVGPALGTFLSVKDLLLAKRQEQRR